MHLLKISLTEHVQELMHEDILLDEEQMKQQFEEEPSLLEEMDPWPKQAKEYVIPMILASPQPIPNLSKMHPFLLAFSTPYCGRVMYFVDYLDTQPPIPFMLTCFLAGSTNYATIYRRKLLFERTKTRAKDTYNKSLMGGNTLLKF